MEEITGLPTLEPVGPWISGDKPVDVLEKILSRAIGVITAIAVLYFVFQIIFAGYSWISAGGDSQKIQTARDKIWQSILGLAIIVFAIALVGFIGFLVGGVDFLDLNAILDLMK